MNDTQLFDFESDFVSTLRCVPMAVRFKLDACGIKLSLRQWSRFTRDDRQALLTAPCESQPEIETYRAALVDLIALRAGEPARVLAEPPCGQWTDVSTVPPMVVRQARSVGLAPPSRAQWAGLTELQRFVLLKLTRDKHDNLNFAPAMVEFELAEALAAA
jgi:hypothetical protein